MEETPKALGTFAEVTTRCSELFRRTIVSLSIVSSALEIPKSSHLISERAFESHRTGQSGVLDLLINRQLIKGITSKDELEPVLRALAVQTTMNVATVISAAAIILSHSTADGVFTAACQMSLDLEPGKWMSELNLNKTIRLETLKEKGMDRVFEDELRSYRKGIEAKSLPTRADLLFRRVSIQLHGDIPKDDVAYFRLSELKRMDELRHGIIHSDGLQKVGLKDGAEAAFFLHEAAHTALRSVAAAYKIPLQADVIFKGLPGADGEALPRAPLPPKGVL